MKIVWKTFFDLIDLKQIISIIVLQLYLLGHYVTDIFFFTYIKISSIVSGNVSFAYKK